MQKKQDTYVVFNEASVFMSAGNHCQKTTNAAAAPVRLATDRPTQAAFSPMNLFKSRVEGNPMTNRPKSSVSRPTFGLPAPLKPAPIIIRTPRNAQKGAR